MPLATLGSRAPTLRSWTWKMEICLLEARLPTMALGTSQLRESFASAEIKPPFIANLDPATISGTYHPTYWLTPKVESHSPRSWAPRSSIPIPDYSAVMVPALPQKNWLSFDGQDLVLLPVIPIHSPTRASLNSMGYILKRAMW